MTDDSKKQLEAVFEKEGFTSEELSGVLGRNEATLCVWRKEGMGPPWVKLGKKYHYPVSGVLAWITANTHPGGPLIRERFVSLLPTEETIAHLKRVQAERKARKAKKAGE